VREKLIRGAGPRVGGCSAILFTFIFSNTALAQSRNATAAEQIIEARKADNKFRDIAPDRSLWGKEIKAS
jgi:hypothetical protein